MYKPRQLAIAARFGLTTVPTVITNSTDAVRRLAAGSPAGVVRKSLGPNTVTEGGQFTMAFTHRLTAVDDAELIDLVRLSVRDYFQQRRLVRQLEDLADQIAERLRPVYEHVSPVPPTP